MCFLWSTQTWSEYLPYSVSQYNAELTRLRLYIYTYMHSPSSGNKQSNWKKQMSWELDHSANICIPWDAFEKECITNTLQCISPIFFAIYFTCSSGNCILFSLHIRVSLPPPIFFVCVRYLAGSFRNGN